MCRLEELCEQLQQEVKELQLKIVKEKERAEEIQEESAIQLASRKQQIRV